jgi:chorismate synthase
MRRLCFSTAGESHGKGLTAIIEGFIAGLPLKEEDINHELKRRQGGYGRSSRMQMEEDRAEITSGIYKGVTTGNPIAIFVSNKDWREADVVACPRPGHADLAGAIKYGLNDIRSVIERASARETVARVVVGAVARRFLAEFGIDVHSHTISIGTVEAVMLNEVSSIDWQQVERSPLHCADARFEKEMMDAIDAARADGDTLGGIFEVIAQGVPIGLGSYANWDKRLDGIIAQAVMSIQSIKGVGIGSGFALASVRGSQAHDAIVPNIAVDVGDRGQLPWRRLSNRAGGIEGGMSNGEPIVIRASVKPIATLVNPLPSMDLRSGEAVEAHYERSDISVVPAAGVVAEAMISIVLAEACLEKFGGDSLKETTANYHNYLESISLWQ